MIPQGHGLGHFSIKEQLVGCQQELALVGEKYLVPLRGRVGKYGHHLRH
jgi:hypothetical protein